MQQPPPPGGSQYGVPPPDISPFASSSSASRPMQIRAEAASPISSRPPPAQPSFEELLPGGASGNFPDDLGGDETDRGGASGNRWPRQETLALLKIRSEMDATFRDATLKGPLWEEVSRKLAELGYRRSAKKCKEKFENVHKYYKRTKDNRTGRPDGKTYRFFSQLEALHSASPSPTTPTQPTVPVLSHAPVPTPVQVQLPSVTSSPATIGFSVTMAGSSANRASQISTPLETTQQPVFQTAPRHGISGSATPTVGISFSSNTESSESDESDDDDTEEIGGSHEQGKRKRRSGSGSGSGSSKKIMQFFEGIMKQVMERQEAMQQKFLETIEKREQDRMIREEAWRRQEMARLTREQEILAQERAMAASRDAAVISFIQKMTGQNIPLPTITAPVITVIPPPPPAPTVTTTPPPPQPQQPPSHRSHSHSHSQPSPRTPPPQQPPPQQQQPQPPPSQQQPHQQHHQSADIVIRPTSTEIVLAGQDQSGSGFEPGSSCTSSRWPKAEVHALIKIRSDMDSRYQEAGPKGPLWEEISAGMRRLGYNRSSKRCKEKWENINKYFKKVKESNKKRPEDSKTCPYFHQLDALYRNKYGGSAGVTSGTGGTSVGGSLEASTYHNSQDSVVVTAPMTPQGPPQPISQQPPAGESHNKIGNGGNDGGNNGADTEGGNGGGSTGGVQIPTSNGGVAQSFYGGLKKPEDIMKDLMERQQHDNNNNNNNYEKFDEGDDESMEDDDEFDDEDDEDEEDRSNQYKIQFQRPNVNVSGTGGTNQPPSTAAGTTPGGNSFLAMVQ